MYAVVFHQLCTINQNFRRNIVYSLALEKADSEYVFGKKKSFASIAIQSSY